MRAFITILAALAALLAPVLPAAGQSYYFGGSGGAVENASTTTVNIGTAAVMAGNDTDGSPVTIGTVSAALSDITVFIHTGFNTSARYMCSLSMDGGSTFIARRLFAWPGPASSSSRVFRYDIPISVPAGTMSAVCQGNGAAAVTVAVTGTVATAGRAPGYTSFVALNPDTVNTFAGLTDVPLSGVWTPQIDPTTEAYGAVIAVASANTDAPSGLAQIITVSLASGPTGGGSEVEFGRWIIGGATSTPPMIGAASPTFPVAIPSGVALYARAQVAGDTTPNIRVGLYGLK